MRHALTNFPIRLQVLIAAKGAGRLDRRPRPRRDEPFPGGKRAATASAPAGVPDYIHCLVRRRGEFIVVPGLPAIFCSNDNRG